MGLYVADSAVKRVLEGENSDVGYITTDKNAIFPEASEEDYSFSYTGADQHWTAPFSGKLTIECKGAGSNNANGGYAKGTISVTKGQKFSIMVGGNGGRTNDGTTYGFGGSTTYGGRGGGGLSGVFTGDTAIGANDASRVVIIAGGAGGGRTGGGAGGGENGQNGNGGSYGYPGAGGTQTGRGSGGNTRSEQFRGGGGSGTYGFGGGGGWRGGNGSGGDGSGDDDCQAGGGSGHCSSKMTQTTLTVGGGAGANTDGSISFHLESKIIIPTPTKITSAGVYHNPKLGLISMSADGENRITISDKNVGAWSNDIDNELSYGGYFQFGNIHGFGVLPEPTPSQRLPIEYQEVEYIEGTGTQYLDTGVSAPNGFKTELKVIITGQVNQTLIGSHNLNTPYGRNNVNTFTIGSTWGLHMNDEMINSLGSINLGQTYEIEGCTILGASYLTVDGVRLTTGTNTSPMSSNNILLLQNQYGLNHGDSCNKARIYSCKMYNDSETLIRDLVPCYRRIDGAIGMYDLVNDQFYANAGTGAFLKGGEINTPALPSEYMEIEYLQSICSGAGATSSGQIIDTLFVPTNKTRVGFKISGWTQSGTSNQIFGEDVSWTQGDGGFAIVTDNYSYNGPASNRPTGFNDGAVHHGTMGFDGVYRDGTLVDNSRSGQALNATQTISLFGLHRNGTYVEHSSCKIHYYIIEEDGVWVRFFMPCYRKLDNKPGMYDLINKEFYTNVGTGEFTKGPDVYSIE